MERALHRFHDILPGTCIAEVYEEAIPRVQKLIENVEEQTSAYQAELLKGTEGAKTAGGEEIKTVRIKDSSRK